MKKILSLLTVIILSATLAHASSIEILPTMSSVSTSPNRVWAGTFQLVWNDLMDEMVKGPVKFGWKNPQIVKELNKQTFKAEMISDDSYYKTFGKISPELKNQIETALKEKFNETSDILGAFDWNAHNEYLFYAMLKKDFKFLNAFDKLQPQKFGKNHEKVEYFGITKKSSSSLDDMIKVLFYNSHNDFAVSITTKGNDIVYLYRTDDDKTFDKLYSDMMFKKLKYKGEGDFLKDDEFKAPNINMYDEKTFGELIGKRVKGTDIVINQALETVEFKMNNEGVELKSEAAIAVMTAMPAPVRVKPRKFWFDDTYVIFLQEKDKSQPYFALRINDVAELNKTGR